MDLLNMVAFANVFDDNNNNNESKKKKTTTARYYIKNAIYN